MKSVFPKQPVKLGMHIILLPLLLLCHGVASIHCSAVHESSQDLRSLLDFKQGISSDPHGALSNWTMSSHFCQWNGVTCTSTQPWRVRSLVLSGASLAGQISSSLGNLTFLYELDLSQNNLVGPLPLLGRLQQLQYLFLNNNNLSGIIPDELGNCSNLYSLDLLSNSLVGSIPPKLRLLSNLIFLRLGSNQLEGSIPGELGQLVKLESLLLDDNKLSGEIPRPIFNLSSLQYLSLDSNRLGKALPPNMGDLLPNLIELSLGNNTFEGHIPASLGNATQLTKIGLSSNNFIETIPTSFGKLSRLTFLNLEGNQLVAKDDLDWEFLDALANCRSLVMLSLAGNNLEGSLPPSIGNLSSNLTYLYLGGNSLSGQIPHNIGKLSALTFLSLEVNYFSGAIEGWIENLKSLEELSLTSNNFTGPIPSSVSNLTHLVYLSLSKNGFDGSIPASLGNLQHLLQLDLSYNNLQGYIPPNIGKLEQLVLFDLSHNNLQGYITLDISKLKQLTDLRFSSNNISGEIPDNFGTCLQLETLLMDQNHLIGNIPTSFKGLQSLKTLNLSHNNLSGTIPTILKNLSLLNKLDLSYNRLQGEIPISGVFANATAVSLNGNWGLCGGVMDLQMPACPAVSRVIEWKHYLTILLILTFGFMSLGMSIYVIFVGKKAPRRPYLLLLSFGKKFPRVSYKDLAQATKNFSDFNLVGRGSYGSVYRGKLTQAKIEVAIKVFDLEMRFADKSFISECDSLRTIRHRNLLPILTACSTVDNNGNDFKALIYEFMPNGNLDAWLHQKHGGVAPKLLGLAQRLSIGVGMADALAYLHHDCGRPIVHCDLKPTNILLDDDMNAHLGDFGIASLVVDYSRSIAVGHSGSSSSLVVRGTIGYIAPEYAQTVHASTYGDVYSFGIVLLEMIIGKRPTDPLFDDGLSITSFVKRNFPDQVLHIIDPHLQEECKGLIQATAGTENDIYRCVLSLVQVALACTRPFPRERMNMREVAINLHAIRKSYVAAIRFKGSHGSVDLV